MSSNLTASAILFGNRLEAISMIKIVISTTTTLIATAVLVACNGSTGGDVTSGGSAPLAKAVCTSSNNWQSVGIGMSATEVQARLGAPTRITSSASTTEYHYERCRGFWKIDTEATETAPTKTSIFDVEGVVTISGTLGVTAVSSPIRITDKIICEFDYYNFPYKTYEYDFAGNFLYDNCRADNNQF